MQEFALKNHYPVKLEPLAAPQSDWSSPADVWATILGLEEQNTRNLLKIAQAADVCGMYGVKVRTLSLLLTTIQHHTHASYFYTQSSHCAISTSFFF